MLETVTLTKQYGDKYALKELNLSVAPGEIFCLLGQNGAGKTTTINLFLGLISPHISLRLFSFMGKRILHSSTGEI